MVFTDSEKKTIINALNVFFMFQKRKPMFSLRITYEGVLKLLPIRERKFIARLFSVDPRRHGFRAPYLGDNNLKPGSELVVIRNQSYKLDGIKQTIPPQYVARHVYTAFRKMALALYKETGRHLYIRSGYRSSGRQLMNFLFHLKFYGFDFEKTLKQVAFPRYSEHAVFYHALDLMINDGYKESSLFARTKEFAWLLKRARDFDFSPSYSEKNSLGVDFEPWHWKYYSLARKKK